MAEHIKTSDKIKKSKMKRGAIRELLGLNANKFATKMRYNDFTDQEVALLKKNGAIQ